MRAVSHQVMWTRLIAIVEEQAQALVRTAFSTSVREAGDLSAGVYDAEGRIMAQAVTGTPGHVNAMADAVAHFIDQIGRTSIAPGDVYLTNNPWQGTGHLHDITVVTPVHHSGALVGFFACTAHVVDIGGRGFGADAASVYEEGLHIPIMRFADAGGVNETLLALIRCNVREPQQVVGDLYALATSNEIGQRRLTEMMDEFGLTDLSELAKEIFAKSRMATEALIGELPKGEAQSDMVVDGFDQPLRLAARVTIKESRVLVDFSGSSPMDAKGINCPFVYTKAYACYALKCAIAPDIPNNHASLAPFEVSAPEGLIVNAIHPAPVALRHSVGHFVPDAVFGALDKLIPGVVPAEGAGCLCNIQLSIRPTQPVGRSAEVLTFNSGGAGARPRLDGLNATAFPSGVMTMPVEATEHAGPVVIWRKELRCDSGGVGAQRGGLGQIMEVGAAPGYECDLQAMFDRVHHPARGRQGGGDGAPTCLTRSDGAPLLGKGKQAIPEGVRLTLAFPGGGGYGPPDARDPDAVRQDVARGYVTLQAARAAYGFDPETS